MIRINLLGVERQKARKAPAADLGQRLTLACSMVLVLAVAGIGWWYWSLREASAQVDADIATATQEAARLQSLLGEVQRFESRKGQLQQRVQLIEQLRNGQSVPVQLLDHVSRSVPDMLWLTSMTQESGALVIEGRSTTQVALADFVGNLGTSQLLAKPIQIVNSQAELVQNAGAGNQSVELVKFSVKANVASAKPAAAGGRGAAPPGAAR